LVGWLVGYASAVAKLASGAVYIHIHKPEGCRRKKKMKATYIWQMINQVGRYLPFFSSFFLEIFLWRFYAFLNKGIKNFLGKIHVKNFWPKKLRKKNIFPFVFSHRFFFIAFLAVSLFSA
jgi:hypothetical protein